MWWSRAGLVNWNDKLLRLRMGFGVEVAMSDLSRATAEAGSCLRCVEET